MRKIEGVRSNNLSPGWKPAFDLRSVKPDCAALGKTERRRPTRHGAGGRLARAAIVRRDAHPGVHPLGDIVQLNAILNR
jgi:hypothetical protein